MTRRFARVFVVMSLTAASLVAGPPALANHQGDWGDAPDTYCTTQLACSGGARHGGFNTLAGPMLGAARDAEDGSVLGPLDGTGDDVNGTCGTCPAGVGGPDDEEGVTVPALLQGQQATIVVNASAAAALNYFIDWNRDGDFADAGEAFSQAVVAGNNNVTVNVPATASAGASYARFRLSTAGGLSFGGSAADGEVEDYAVTIAAAPPDFGDAPDSYSTTLASNGARHTLSGLLLGANRDGEADASAPLDGTGDDVTGAPDDEDGVTVPTFTAGQDATIVVSASAPGQLDYFIDWNRDGDFADAGESFSQAVVAGNNNVVVAVPATASAGSSYARFRLSSAGGLSFNGSAPDGEVEDYTITIQGAPTPSCFRAPTSGSIVSASTATGSNGLVAADSGCGIVAINPGSGTRSQLLGSGAADSLPQVAPSGSLVAFVNGGNIWTAEFPSGNNRVQVTTAGGFSAPAWAPNSSTLVFESGTGLNTAPAQSGASVSPLNGTSAGDTDADYSPDGRFIVFDSTTAPGGIARVGANGSGGRTQLAGTAAGDDDPHVAPGGSVVYFAAPEGIVSLPWPGGGSRTTLPGTTPGDSEPFPSPDGTLVGFTGASLATVNASGVGGRAAVTGTAAGDSSGSWSTASAGPPGVPPPAPGGQIQFTAASACGSAVMLTLVPPSSVTVAATNSLPGHGVALSASGLPSYLAFDPATGQLSVSSNPFEFLSLLVALLGDGALSLIRWIDGIPVIGDILGPLLDPALAVITPPTVTITASDTVAPGAAAATCSKLVRVSVFGGI